MNRLYAILVAICVPLLLAADSPKPIGDDPLDGEWEIVEMVFKGKVQNFGGPNGGWIKITKEGMSFKYPGSENFGRPFSITLHTRKQPRQIDVQYGDDEMPVVSRGIYEVAGDKLRMIENNTEGERPRDFDALKNPTHTYFGLKRVQK
jgi:uncharacterized protein (TIGR03067 family)